MTYYDQVKDAADAIRSRIPEVPQVGVVLGSGLGDFASSLDAAVTMPYGELPHWPASRVVGHEGKLVVGKTRGRTIAALAGRSHLYEGRDVRTVTFAVRALGLLGVRTLILTNAAGGVNTGFSQGALMVIDDHINLMGSNPLAGENDERFGARFPDMTEVYSSRLRGIADRQGTDPISEDDRRRRGRDVDRSRGYRGAPHEDGRARHLVHHQHGGRRAAAAARSRGSDGNGAPDPRSVHRAAGGRPWTPLMAGGCPCRSSTSRRAAKPSS